MWRNSKFHNYTIIEMDDQGGNDKFQMRAGHSNYWERWRRDNENQNTSPRYQINARAPAAKAAAMYQLLDLKHSRPLFCANRYLSPAEALTMRRRIANLPDVAPD
jgi:hypothetical protein